MPFFHHLQSFATWQILTYPSCLLSFLRNFSFLSGLVALHCYSINNLCNIISNISHTAFYFLCIYFSLILDCHLLENKNCVLFILISHYLVPDTYIQYLFCFVLFYLMDEVQVAYSYHRKTKIILKKRWIDNIHASNVTL